jgi:hypothetical protein
VATEREFKVKDEGGAGDNRTIEEGVMKVKGKGERNKGKVWLINRGGGGGSERVPLS